MRFLLLVEGSDDLHLIRNVAREQGVEIDHKEFRDCGGIERLLHEILPVSLKSSVASVVVVVDADLDLTARWNAVAYQLAAAGYAVPKSPPAKGLILTDRRPAVGVWLMPDNSLPGSEIT